MYISNKFSELVLFHFGCVVSLAGIFGLWIFYVGGYAIVYPIRLWAEKKRGMPFEDPELTAQRRLMIPAAVWMFLGLLVSIFTPINLESLFIPGLVIAILGLILVVIVFHSFASQPGLATEGIHRYSRNPNYIGWTIYFLGLALIGWSTSIWSYFFLFYVVYTALYLHWNVTQEEVFLSSKYGDSYTEYLEKTPRYFGRPREVKSESKEEFDEQ